MDPDEIDFVDLPTWQDVQAMMDEDDVEGWEDYLAYYGFDNVEGPAWPFPPLVVSQHGGYVFNCADRVIIQALASRRAPRTGLTFERYRVSVRDAQNVPIEHKLEVIVQILGYILDNVLENVGGTDRVRLVIDSDHLPRGPIYTAITNKDQLTVDRWMLAVESVLET